jgi:hypothetical protein
MGRLQNNPSIGWVHPKSTHTHPLTLGNKKKNKNNYILNPTSMKAYFTSFFHQIFVKNEKKTSSIEQTFFLC